jgi:hypothetical protein
VVVHEAAQLDAALAGVDIDLEGLRRLVLNSLFSIFALIAASSSSGEPSEEKPRWIARTECTRVIMKHGTGQSVPSIRAGP